MKGNIKNREDIPNILGFINQTDKTGVLTLVNKGDQIEIGFIKGNVNAAVHKRSGVQELIKEYLVNSGKISKDAFERIKGLHKDTRKPYEEILIDEKSITEKEWKDIIHFKIQEIMDELFNWDSGSYEFLEDIIMYENSSVKISINTQGLIMEGMRRIDEWPQIRTALPSASLVFALAENKQIPDNIGAEEKRLIEIIDGSKDLKTLVEISGLGKFLTYQAVYNLKKMGLIKIIKRRRRPARHKPREKVPVNKYLVFSWIVILLVIVLTGYAGRVSFPYTGSFTGSQSVSRQAYDSYNMETIDYVLRIFYLKNSYYPESLEILAEDGWIPQNIISRYIYFRNKDDYTLRVKN